MVAFLFYFMKFVLENYIGYFLFSKWAVPGKKLSLVTSKDLE